jgi:hypothetical protein
MRILAPQLVSLETRTSAEICNRRALSVIRSRQATNRQRDLMDERRQSPRKRSFLKGMVYFNHRRASIECTVRDFSEYGARLQFPAPATLPDAIELEIPAREKILQAQVRWRRDDEVGVSLDEAYADGGPEMAGNGDITQRIAALEREMTKLHRLVMDLRNELRRIRGDD